LEIDDQSWLSAIDRNWLMTTHEALARELGNGAVAELFANVARILIDAFNLSSALLLPNWSALSR
jgi:hypothetical protein